MGRSPTEEAQRRRRRLLSVNWTSTSFFEMSVFPDVVNLSAEERGLSCSIAWSWISQIIRPAMVRWA
jgi:hypothetical protein